jgi:hypothetical protein
MLSPKIQIEDLAESICTTIAVVEHVEKIYLSNSTIVIATIVRLNKQDLVLTEE